MTSQPIWDNTRCLDLHDSIIQVIQYIQAHLSEDFERTQLWRSWLHHCGIHCRRKNHRRGHHVLLSGNRTIAVRWSATLHHVLLQLGNNVLAVSELPQLSSMWPYFSNQHLKSLHPLLKHIGVARSNHKNLHSAASSRPRPASSE